MKNKVKIKVTRIKLSHPDYRYIVYVPSYIYDKLGLRNSRYFRSFDNLPGALDYVRFIINRIELIKWNERFYDLNQTNSKVLLFT